MQQIIIIFHIVLAVALVALILVQQGKGAGMGGSFGGGASQTVFGSRGAGGFLLKLTCGLAVLFFATSLTLSYLSSHWKDTATEQLTLVQHKPVISVGKTHDKAAVVGQKGDKAASSVQQSGHHHG